MRTFLLGFFILFSIIVEAQRQCGTTDYINLLQSVSPSHNKRTLAIESFISTESSKQKTAQDNVPYSLSLIKIPVVIHILYNTPDQDIPDEQVFSQLVALNRDFRRFNADTMLTPEQFRSRAADVAIEFVLATSDPEGRPTAGIVRRYTKETSFKVDDKIKFNESGGSNAWDTKNYLNIWVGKFQSVIGYATLPGSAPETDGIVIATQAFGSINTSGPYNMGRTAVHEAGHWLGLKHIWGDQYCGDDAVDDTPAQGNFTPGCPTGFRTSCNNATTGDMYMNYMDYTSDACVNLFTEGQKLRMRSLFADGGPRNAILSSKGLMPPWNFSAAEPETGAPVEVKLFPNPAHSEIRITPGTFWVGSRLAIADITGKVVKIITVTSPEQKISLNFLSPGVYFIRGQKEGSVIVKKFIKL
jgi:hypothetical protein